jgi:hypothetical protein
MGLKLSYFSAIYLFISAKPITCKIEVQNNSILMLAKFIKYCDNYLIKKNQMQNTDFQAENYGSHLHTFYKYCSKKKKHSILSFYTFRYRQNSHRLNRTSIFVAASVCIMAGRSFT